MKDIKFFKNDRKKLFSETDWWIIVKEVTRPMITIGCKEVCLGIGVPSDNTLKNSEFWILGKSDLIMNDEKITSKKKIFDNHRKQIYNAYKECIRTIHLEFGKLIAKEISVTGVFSPETPTYGMVGVYTTNIKNSKYKIIGEELDETFKPDEIIDVASYVTNICKLDKSFVSLIGAAIYKFELSIAFPK